MSKIVIDKETHIYKVDNVIKPSVSDILKTYFDPCPFWTEDARALGHARHEWFNFLAQGLIPELPPDPRIAGAVDGFKKFMAEVQPVFVSGEVSYFHPTLGYCGTPDAVLKISNRLCVCDFKPINKNKRTMVQTALYYMLLRANGIMVQDRYELRLYDGLYRLEKHTDPQDIYRAEIMATAYMEKPGKRKDEFMSAATVAAEFYK